MSERGFRFVILVCKDRTCNRHDFGTYSQYSNPIWARLEAANDIISGTIVEEVSMNARVKFRDSMSNRFRPMRPTQFVMDEQTTTATGERTAAGINAVLIIIITITQNLYSAIMPKSAGYIGAGSPCGIEYFFSAFRPQSPPCLAFRLIKVCRYRHTETVGGFRLA